MRFDPSVHPAPIPLLALLASPNLRRTVVPYRWCAVNSGVFRRFQQFYVLLKSHVIRRSRAASALALVDDRELLRAVSRRITIDPRYRIFIPPRKVSLWRDPTPPRPPRDTADVNNNYYRARWQAA